MTTLTALCFFVFCLLSNAQPQPSPTQISQLSPAPTTQPLPPSSQIPQPSVTTQIPQQVPSTQTLQPSPLSSTQPLPQALSTKCIWNYVSPNTDWPTLPCVQSCSGSVQSPVNVASYVRSLSLPPLTFTGYEGENLTLTNKGPTLEVEFPEDYVGYFKPGYSLLQFHFHTPAENTIGGVQKQAAMHMVHRNTAITPAGYAVLTFLYGVVNGPDNAFLAPIVSAIPLINSTGATTTVALAGLSTIFDSLKKSNQDAYVNFIGSFTTPPCTEGVDWYIFLNPLNISVAQYNVFHNTMGSNYRPVQRTLYNVTAYVPSVPVTPTNPPTTPTAPPTTPPTAPPTAPPTGTVPAPMQVTQPTPSIVMDNSYFAGFWVVLTLLILVTIGLGVTLVMLKKARKNAVVRVQ